MNDAVRFHSLDAWLAWQETLHPKAIDLGLERVRTVLQRMGREQPPQVVVTVTGTNGKGSTVVMLETILRTAGYRVGAYTSPHLLRYNERIRINGEEVDDARLCQAFAMVDQARNDVSLTYFEFGTLAAIEIFADAGLDVVILEVGLGGRLDAVNVLDADVAVISSIGLDHSDWLGETRDAVGREKAGIMRHDRPVVVGDPDPPASVLEAAAQCGARLYRFGVDFSVRCHDTAWDWRGPAGQRTGLPAPALRGEVQYRNAATVLMVLELLTARLPVTQADIRTGLATVSLPGRFQVIPGAVPLVLDVAHNPQAAAVLAQTLRTWPTPGRTHAVLAIMADKDIAGVIAPLADGVDVWYPTTVAMARAATVDRLVAVLRQRGGTAAIQPQATVAQALAAARAAAQVHDRIVVFGSFYTVAEAMGELERHA